MIPGPRGSSGREGGLFPVKEASQVLDLKAPRGAFIFWAPGRGGFDQGGLRGPFSLPALDWGLAKDGRWRLQQRYATSSSGF